MGNSPSAGGLLGKGENPFQVDIRGREAGVPREYRSGAKSFTESWKMTYKVGKSTCDFFLSKSLNFCGDDCEWVQLEIKISDDVHGSGSLRELCEVTVLIDEAGLLRHMYHPSMKLRIANNLTSSATNKYGSVTTETICDIYGSGTRRGLVVREWKTNSNDKSPYMGTVTHYFVDDENGKNVGLSVAVKRIRSCNGKIEFDVDGPKAHPADALAFMIKQVLKTGTWKPTHCPHCANKYIAERLSESESDIDNVPTPPLCLRSQIAGSRSIVSNPGWFRGKDIGNTYIKHLHGRKW